MMLDQRKGARLAPAHPGQEELSPCDSTPPPHRVRPMSGGRCQNGEGWAARTPAPERPGLAPDPDRQRSAALGGPDPDEALARPAFLRKTSGPMAAKDLALRKTSGPMAAKDLALVLAQRFLRLRQLRARWWRARPRPAHGSASLGRRLRASRVRRIRVRRARRAVRGSRGGRFGAEGSRLCYQKGHGGSLSASLKPATRQYRSRSTASGRVTIKPEAAFAATHAGRVYLRGDRVACGSSCAPSTESYAGTLGALVRKTESADNTLFPVI